eukprot:gnl/MRDRNA2_/MRDRNA2_73646_c0_seq2.p1 gnl/MRDRNA2_/MRDRNA2_73646_c0~~gnl/MRDRNA2_/MRDRNA2_73646_c0_seq2.p1  ORF type:complete len:410 (+),score=101.70 gnl/MRDRNA2_/MRDRNA2_73646_c0_seq2:77-1306(+)
MFDFDQLDEIEHSTMFDFDELDQLEAAAARLKSDPPTCEWNSTENEDASVADLKIQQAMADAFQRRWLQCKVSGQENSAGRLALDQRIQDAMKNARERHQKEASVHDDLSAEAVKVFDHHGWQQDQHSWQEQQWLQWQETHAWPQYDSRMQPALVTQSDGRSAAGFSWEPHPGQWNTMLQSQSLQFQNWQTSQSDNWQGQNWVAQNIHTPSSWMSHTQVQAPVSLKPQMAGDLMKPRPWASEITHRQKKNDEAASVAVKLLTTADNAAPLRAPMPLPVTDSKDLRSSWRQQVNKLLAERPIKERRFSSKPKGMEDNAPAPDAQRFDDGTTNKGERDTIMSTSEILPQDLNQIGQTLHSLYTRRRELDETPSPNISEKMPDTQTTGRAQKSVSWADMDEDGELVSVHGGG